MVLGGKGVRPAPCEGERCTPVGPDLQEKRLLLYRRVSSSHQTAVHEIHSLFQFNAVWRAVLSKSRSDSNAALPQPTTHISVRVLTERSMICLMSQRKQTSKIRSHCPDRNCLTFSIGCPLDGGLYKVFFMHDSIVTHKSVVRLTSQRFFCK